MKLFLKTALVMNMLVLGMLPFSNVSAASNVGTELQKYVNNLKTYEAKFVQTQPDDTLFTLNTSTGYFKLDRPGKLLWQYYSPEEQKIVVDGPNLWVYDTDLDQVTVRPIDDVKAELPLSWLLYKEPIEDKFTIIENKTANGMTWFNLAPKQATYFQSIEVGIKNGEMQEVWMYQDADNVTKVRFTSIKSNQVIPLQNFNFQLPEGADLIGTPQ